MKKFVPLLICAAFSGCAVYVPTVPSTPLLRSQGEVEVTAGLRGLSSFETSAAWSPAPHLLVTSEAALQTSHGSETRNNVTTDYRNLHRQAGLGLGTYRLLGQDQSTYLAAVGGVGFAAARVYDPHIENFILLFFNIPTVVAYEARYQRYYGQVYVAKLEERSSYGLSVRGTFVNYSRLERAQEPISASSRFFVEPTFFVRYGRGPIQGQATVGFSAPVGANRESPDNRNLTPTTNLIGAGIVVRPHLFQRRASAVVP